jgi:phage terminase large subunit-like protein
MGQRLDWIWLDEEPPNDIFTQCVTRTLTTGGVVSMTFTPEAGLTEIVGNFMNNLKNGQFLIQATWEDVTEKRDEQGNIIQRGHLTAELKEQLLSVYSPHERDMRSRGIPIFGSGAVFPVHLEEQIRCPAFEIPKHWPRICGLDFGWDHPTAAVWIAWDRDGDTLYVYDCYKQSKATAVIHADALIARGNVITAWPKDGMQSDKGSGIDLAEQYRNQGVNMLPDFFRNRPNVADSKGQFSIEAGIQEIYSRMENGTFKVFAHLHEWFQEFKQYYREEGKIVPRNDDLMSATRYAACSADRFARTLDSTSFNHSGKINYLPLGPGFK